MGAEACCNMADNVPKVIAWDLDGCVRNIMRELKTDPKWSNTIVACASCCDEPAWARECIQKFELGDGLVLGDVISIEEIYKGNKARDHITAIAKKANCQPEEIVFLDNEKGNCKTVAGIGCTVGYTPSGVTREAWEATLEAFPAPGEIINSR